MKCGLVALWAATLCAALLASGQAMAGSLVKIGNAASCFEIVEKSYNGSPPHYTEVRNNCGYPVTLAYASSLIGRIYATVFYPLPDTSTLNIFGDEVLLCRGEFDYTRLSGSSCPAVAQGGASSPSPGSPGALRVSGTTSMQNPFRNSNSTSSGPASNQNPFRTASRTAQSQSATKAQESATPGGNAKECASVDQYRVTNTCTTTISVMWCDDTSDGSESCKGGFDSFVNLGPGKGYPLFPMRDRKTTITQTLYGACFGANKITSTAHSTRYSCQ